MTHQNDYLRVEHGERIDKPDFEHAASRSQVSAIGQVVDGLMRGGDTEAMSVVSGFGVSNPSGNTIRVEPGVAILGRRTDGQIRYGCIASPPNPIQVDVSSYSPSASTFTVYIRFHLADADFTNRRFWNSAAATPVEIVRNVATRHADDWQVRIDILPPGDEWHPIGTIVPDDLNGAGAGVTDTRTWTFEPGSAAGAYESTDSDWGDTDDRNADRATYGIKSLGRFVKAVQRQLQDILGGSPPQWWRAVSSTGSLFALDQNRLHILGRAATIAQRMAGHLDPSSDDTWDLGDDSTPRRWANIYARGLALGGSRIDSAVNALLTRLTIPIYNGAASDRTLFLAALNAATASAGFRVYVRTDGTIDLAWNAIWGGATWSHADTAVSAICLRYDRNGQICYVLSRTAAASTWSDVVTGGANWNRLAAFFLGNTEAYSGAYFAETLATAADQLTGAEHYANNQLVARGAFVMNAATTFSVNNSVGGVLSVNAGLLRVTLNTPIDEEKVTPNMRFHIDGVFNVGSGYMTEPIIVSSMVIDFRPEANNGSLLSLGAGCSGSWTIFGEP